MGIFFKNRRHSFFMYRFSCRGGGRGGGIFFSKIEDSHLYRFSCWGPGGGAGFFVVFFFFKNRRQSFVSIFMSGGGVNRRQ